MTARYEPRFARSETMAEVQNQALHAEATTYLLGLRFRFPLLLRALQTAAGAPPPADLTDFPAPVLVAAVHAARVQEHGLATLLASARTEAALPGPDGASVLALLESPAFDYYAASLVDRGAVRVQVAYLDFALGVIPLVPLALHIWWAGHRHVPASADRLLEVARAYKVCNGKLFCPDAGLPPLYAALATADATGAPIRVDSIYHAIARTVYLEPMTPQSAMICALVAGGPASPMRWDEYVTRLSADYQSRVDRNLPFPRFLRRDLDLLLRTLEAFGAARSSFGRARALAAPLAPDDPGVPLPTFLRLVRAQHAPPPPAPVARAPEAPRPPSGGPPPPAPVARAPEALRPPSGGPPPPAPAARAPEALRPPSGGPPPPAPAARAPEAPRPTCRRVHIRKDGF